MIRGIFDRGFIDFRLHPKKGVMINFEAAFLVLIT